MPRLDQLGEDAYYELLDKMADAIDEALGVQGPDDGDLLNDAALAVLELLRSEGLVED